MTRRVAPSLPPEPVAETPQAALLSPAEAAALLAKEQADLQGRPPSPAKWTERPPVGHPDRAWYLPDNSAVRPVAMQIIAMRLSGMEDAEIAKALNISEKTISPYVYRATKNGWLDIDYDPKERLQFQVMHKVVEQLEAGLKDTVRMNTGMKVQTAVALKIAEGTVYKSFDQQVAAQAASTVVAVQVVMPDGPRQQIREETTGGTPAFIDAETV